MYVPGKLSDVERVLIDIGTGYYVEKVRGWGGCCRVGALELPITLFMLLLSPFSPFPSHRKKREKGVKGREKGMEKRVRGKGEKR